MGASERKRQKKIKAYVIARDGLECCYCEIPLSVDEMTLEHIVPNSKRGTFNTTNLTIACAPCNNRRGNRPFFEYCKNFNFSQEKLLKYHALYFNNLKIKILNIAKEECLTQDQVIPYEIINQACSILKIKTIDFSEYETLYKFEIKFDTLADRKKIKYCFEQLIKIIEMNSC